MAREVLFKSETAQSREEVAAYLQEIVDNLRTDQVISLRMGEQSVTVHPPHHLTFDVIADRRGPDDRSGTIHLEFAVEWQETEEGGERLEIE